MIYLGKFCTYIHFYILSIPRFGNFSKNISRWKTPFEDNCKLHVKFSQKNLNKHIFHSIVKKNVFNNFSIYFHLQLHKKYIPPQCIFGRNPRYSLVLKSDKYIVLHQLLQVHQHIYSIYFYHDINKKHNQKLSKIHKLRKNWAFNLLHHKYIFRQLELH